MLDRRISISKPRRKVKLAVKRLNKEASSLTASPADQTFNYEVAELSRLKHRNLIEILGYSNDNMAGVCLVYPYLVNGNLEDRILMRRTEHQEVRPPIVLTWLLERWLGSKSEADPE